VPKLAITGKGGVGKTTLAALLADLYAAEGRTVLAIDADPDANLGSALGLSPADLSEVHPIAEMKDLVAERTGTQPGQYGGMFTLNPRVDDIPDRFSVRRGRVRLLILGTIKQGGAGCFCPESTLLKNLVRHLLVGRDEVVILDMEAGIEHLSRGTARAVDKLIIVVEPGRRSLETAVTIKTLAKDLGLNNIAVVGNKIRNEADREFIKTSLPGTEILGFINYDPAINDADLAGASLFTASQQTVKEVRNIYDKLLSDGRLPAEKATGGTRKASNQ
jgi:CO dehydrogenase maturation factor